MPVILLQFKGVFYDPGINLRVVSSDRRSDILLMRGRTALMAERLRRQNARVVLADSSEGGRKDAGMPHGGGRDAKLIVYMTG